jgi:hypothetical protein
MSCQRCENLGSCLRPNFRSETMGKKKEERKMKKSFVVLSIRPLSGCMVASSWLCTIVITGLQVYRFSKIDEYIFLGRVTPCLQDMHYAALVTRAGLERRGHQNSNNNRVSETTTPKTNVLAHSKMVHVANFVDVYIVCFVDESFL